MELRTDRVGLLLDQLASSRELALDRLAGLGDEEYLWEPAPGAWSVRARGASVSSFPIGPGEWQLDGHRGELDPAPLRTIAWLLGHVTNGLAGRWEWTFGARAADPATLTEFTPRAADALRALGSELDRWAASVATLTDPQLDEPGHGAYPWGLDPDLPFIGIVWWVNREVIHHLAEAALLRDLYGSR